MARLLPLIVHLGVLAVSQSECVAAAMAGGITAPLRLKDLLELDCDSCSAAGFRCYPRRLLGEPPAPAARHLLEPPSLSLRRQRRPSKLSSLSRSLSRRPGSGGGLFWRRRGEDEDAAAAAAAPSGSGSGSESGASSAETATSDGSASAGRRGSRCESDSDLSTAATSAGDEQHEVVNYYYCCFVATAIIMHASVTGR